MQQAVCPLCGGATELEAQPRAQVTCPHCGADLEAVMNGRAVILKAVKPALKEAPEALKICKKAAGTPDPKERYQLLSQGLQKYPDSLSLNRALLFHGRLHEQQSGSIDHSLIKCWLLHPFEAPEAHSENERRAYYAELFEGEQLKKCMTLSPDGETFYHEYLEEICARYVEIFLKGSSRHMVSMFGIPLGQPEKRLSAPAAQMLKAINADELLSPPQKADLTAAFRRGYLRVLGSTRYLDALL